MKKKNGFTLIELLAVIIILGILMIIAIPSVTRYISDSRKSAYIDTAKQLIGSARNLVNSGDLEMYDTDTTYYIEGACIKSENAYTSPYDEFEKAYVVVAYDGKGYTYYWTSVDKAGQGIKNIVRFDHLDTDNVESDLSGDDVKTNRGIDGRSKTVVISEQNNCKKEGSNDAEIQIDGETGKKSSIIYPNGKNKKTVEVGDIVKIETEDFYVVSNNGTDLVLITRYNLKVGNVFSSLGDYVRTYSVDEEGYGLQDSSVVGWERDKPNALRNGVTTFSETKYWDDKVGAGLEYPGEYARPNYPYIYDSNSILYNYVQNYKTYLETNGVHIKEARLLKYSEAIDLGCSYYSCSSANPLITKTSFWIGNAANYNDIYTVEKSGNFEHWSNTTNCWFGVRPVIVI